VRNLRIGTRLSILIVTLLLALLIVGLTSYISLIQANDALGKLEQAVKDKTVSENLGRVVDVDLLRLANSANLGTISVEQAGKDMAAFKATYGEAWQSYLNIAPVGDKAAIQEKKQILDDAVAELESLFATKDRSRLGLFVANDLNGLMEPIDSEVLNPARRQIERDTQAILERSQAANRNFQIIMLAVGIIGVVIATVLGILIYNSIVEPVEKIAATVEHVTNGDFSVRTALTGEDELAALGRGFDRLLDERVLTLVKAEQENDELNNSIIMLLQTVAQLSQRDLTIRASVNEDITGPMADALNLLTTETAQVLTEVTRVSEEVATASEKVKAQSDMVIIVANDERQEVEQAAAELTAAARDMNNIADLAAVCNRTAEGAIETTRKALETVTSTIGGITSTRDTIRETEKRIKRLGERSQEISGVVNLINTIAERTHILALNASMHAASAGEAGRGFAVVADEVQRLAENAREATSQITTLVSSIQMETADTVAAMNLAISQVVDGSRMAEQAGEQMKKTQQTTEELVASVQQIATSSQEQARVSNALLDRIKQIQKSTLQTGQRLLEQNQYTSNLVEYAKALLSSVRVFKLPFQERA